MTNIGLRWRSFWAARIAVSAALAGVTAALAACDPTSAKMPERNPAEAGRTMTAVIDEVVRNLPRKPKGHPEVGFQFCDTGLNSEKQVRPMANDPWHVRYNVYSVGSGLVYSVSSYAESEQVFRTLTDRLRSAGGWELKDVRLTSGAYGGFRGKKNGVSVVTMTGPTGPGGVDGLEATIRFDAGCFKHPHA
ncbi:hypothetical protein [Actinomadura rayongensis]|uniref:Lipoprotein n=1 Tax=Actinomadura rayongensis TaxID=1429076 RepID=A0A6I4W6B9_9ACTN|nr:hypothetical protein [Actinomadura rayongensis]MXQ64823.1 hypothetical protein [Actinomadura rayongensis]